MREKPDCQDLQKHLKEGRRDCWNKALRTKSEKEKKKKQKGKQERKAVYVREDTRRKCGQMVFAERECERGEERGGS